MPGPSTGMRDRVRDLCPVWLREGVDERRFYSLGLCADGVLDKLTQGIQGRMPTRAASSFPPILSADRRISRGLTESDESFAGRLQRAFETWQLAGIPRAVLSQVLGYLLAVHPAVRMV